MKKIVSFKEKCEILKVKKLGAKGVFEITVMSHKLLENEIIFDKSDFQIEVDFDILLLHY